MAQVDYSKKQIEVECVNLAFIETMCDIGRYGLEKYGDNSFEASAQRGDRSRGEGALGLRTSSLGIGQHINDHYYEYLQGVRHDKFGTFKHQLAAAAFNAMMEYHFAGLESE